MYMDYSALSSVALIIKPVRPRENDVLKLYCESINK